MSQRLRLLKVLVQPVVVLDDGEDLQEQVGQVLVIPAATWASFTETGGGFDQHLVALAAAVEQLTDETETEPAPAAANNGAG